MKRRGSLATRILWALMAVSGLSFVAMGLVIIRQGRHSAEAALAIKIESISNILQRSAGIAMFNVDKDSLQEMANSVVRDPDMHFVAFVDTMSKKVLAAAEKCPSGKTCDPLKIESVGASKDGLVRVEFPLVHEGKDIGRVHLDHPPAKANNQLVLLVVASVSILVALQSILSFLIVRRSVQSISSSVTGVDELSNQVSRSASELNAVTSSLTEDNSRTAASLEEISATIERLNRAFLKNVEDAGSAGSLASDVEGQANMGREEVKELSEAMNTIVSQSDRIGEVSSVIDGIAFQTNLLALNAAVEAARAGDHGRGFAVVADAVRGLAQQAGASAKEISRTIQESIEKSQQGAKTVERVARHQLEFVALAQRIAEIIGELAVSIKSHQTTLSEVMHGLSVIDEASAINSEMAAKVSQMSKELSVTAEDLNRQTQHIRMATLGK